MVIRYVEEPGRVAGCAGCGQFRFWFVPANGDALCDANCWIANCGRRGRCGRRDGSGIGYAARRGTASRPGRSSAGGGRRRVAASAGGGGISDRTGRGGRGAGGGAAGRGPAAFLQLAVCSDLGRGRRWPERPAVRGGGHGPVGVLQLGRAGRRRPALRGRAGRLPDRGRDGCGELRGLRAAAGAAGVCPASASPDRAHGRAFLSRAIVGLAFPGHYRGHWSGRAVG